MYLFRDRKVLKIKTFALPLVKIKKTQQINLETGNNKLGNILKNFD